MTTSKAEQMRRYVARIRNEAKRDYATRYAIWLCRSESDRETVPEPQAFHLSYMGAQAVRMSLNAIVKNSESPS